MYVIGGLFVKIKLYMELTINFNCTSLLINIPQHISNLQKVCNKVNHNSTCLTNTKFTSLQVLHKKNCWTATSQLIISCPFSVEKIDKVQYMQNEWRLLHEVINVSLVKGC